MDINVLKQFQIFNKLDENEIKKFQKKMKKINVPEGQNFIVNVNWPNLCLMTY